MSDTATQSKTSQSSDSQENSQENKTPPTIDYWHVWTDENGVSHQSRCQIQNFVLKSISPPASPQWLDKYDPAETTITFTVQPIGWVGSWHETPNPSGLSRYRAAGLWKLWMGNEWRWGLVRFPLAKTKARKRTPKVIKDTFLEQ